MAVDRQDLKPSHDAIIRTMEMIVEDAQRHSSCFVGNVNDFVQWFESKYKFRYRNHSDKFIVKKGEIYNCCFGYNIGSEQDKCRPAMILQNEKGNIHSSTTIVAPITDEIKAFLPTHVEISKLSSDCSVKGIVLVEQLRCISKRRLGKKLDFVRTDIDSWNNIITAIKRELDVYYIRIDTCSKK